MQMFITTLLTIEKMLEIQMSINYRMIKQIMV